MFEDPYHTHRCRSYRVEEIKKEIKKSSMVGDNPFRLQEYGFNNAVCALTGPDTNIPPFAHPLLMDAKEYGLFGDMAVFDARSVVRVDRDGSVKITATDEFNFRLLRTQLTAYAKARHLTDIHNASWLPMVVFTSWISEILTRRLDLDPVSQQKTQIITAIYYLSLMKEPTEVGEFSDREMAGIARTLNARMRVDVELVLNLLKILPSMENVSEYVNALKDHGGSIRFENLSVALLYTLTAGSWFCSNANEVIPVALEHIPTWVAIIASTVGSRGYKSTLISKTIDRYDRQDAGREFLSTLYKLPGLRQSN